MEGRIVQKLECRPFADKMYMDMKSESIRKACVPKQQVQSLEKVVTNFKPISDHKHNVSSSSNTSILSFINLFYIFNWIRLSITTKRRMKARNLVLTRVKFLICCSMLLRNINITTLKI